MARKAHAITQIDFHEKKLEEDHIAKVEQLFRTHEHVTIRAVESNRIDLDLLGEEKINYAVLDELKTLLQSLGYADFSIDAEEYLQTGNDYHYTGSEK